MTVSTAIDTTGPCTADDLKHLGREDGSHLFSIYEKLVEADGNSIPFVKVDVFETWCNLRLMECEIRLHGAGLAENEIADWRAACVDELMLKLAALVANMSRIH
jgi:hypothetical protein